MAGKLSTHVLDTASGKPANGMSLALYKAPPGSGQLELVKQAGVYSEEEVQAIGRLIISGTAQCFKEVIDRVREEQVADVEIGVTAARIMEFSNRASRSARGLDDRRRIRA